MVLFLTAAAGTAVIVAAASVVFAPYFNDMVDDPVGVSENQQLEPGRAYDFIVVGGGSAGAVVAARLSEDPLVSVLLLEAGGDGNLASRVPILTPVNLDSAIDWSYTTHPDGREVYHSVHRLFTA